MMSNKDLYSYEFYTETEGRHKRTNYGFQEFLLDGIAAKFMEQQKTPNQQNQPTKIKPNKKQTNRSQKEGNFKISGST